MLSIYQHLSTLESRDATLPTILNCRRAVNLAPCWESLSHLSLFGISQGRKYRLMSWNKLAAKRVTPNQFPSPCGGKG